ncbi:MAG: hypothetical protein TU35_002515 [Thermoproteus sp. AZ2]|uniref:Uncharacterized protein n=1 Tax=Thermoproteus sp. AZ2 TaxID=1609232 RepID=A0ACC6V078_9CREN
MYWVLLGRERVLVTGRAEDLALADDGWRIAGAYASWAEAFRRAVKLASSSDLVLEWYLEEELQALRSAQTA